MHALLFHTSLWPCCLLTPDVNRVVVQIKRISSSDKYIFNLQGCFLQQSNSCYTDMTEIRIFFLQNLIKVCLVILEIQFLGR